MTTLRTLPSPAATLILLVAAICLPLPGCSHLDTETGAAGPAGAAAHPQQQLTPQQQIQQIQSNPNVPEKLKKVQMGNVSGPPQHNRVGGPP